MYNHTDHATEFTPDCGRSAVPPGDPAIPDDMMVLLIALMLLSLMIMLTLQLSLINLKIVIRRFSLMSIFYVYGELELVRSCILQKKMKTSM